MLTVSFLVATHQVVRVRGAGYTAANGDYIRAHSDYTSDGITYNGQFYANWVQTGAADMCTLNFMDYDTVGGTINAYTGWGIGCGGAHRYGASPGYSGGTVTTCLNTDPTLCSFGVRPNYATLPVPSITWAVNSTPVDAPATNKEVRCCLVQACVTVCVCDSVCVCVCVCCVYTTCVCLTVCVYGRVCSRAHVDLHARHGFLHSHFST
jgi:hypothetical protein